MAKEKQNPLVDPLEEQKSVDTVTVNKVKLGEMVDQMLSMRKELDRLTAAADLGRLAKYDATHTDELKRVVRLNKLGDKVITGWSGLVTDDKLYDTHGRQVGERQTRKLFFEDGSTLEVDYLRSVREIVKMDAEIQEERKTKDGTIFKVLCLENGKEYEVDAKFIN